MSATISGTAVTISSTFTAPNRPPETPFNASPSASSTQSAVSGAIPPSTASSLYLYTFLATLVLLLSVSGAVVIRSLMMRVRQRRAIEEAIRNGTYVPPEQVPRRQPPVKPILFDAHLDDGKGGEKGWSGLVPVAAQFLPSPQPSLPTPTTARTAPHPQRSFVSRLRGFTLPNILGLLILPDRPHQPVAAGPTQLELAEAAFSQNTDETRPAPSSVRLSFLIAMPDPAHPHRYPAARSASFSSDSSGRPSTSSEKGKERDPSPTTFMQRTIDEEPELPYLEFGTTDVPIRRPKSDGSEGSSSSKGGVNEDSALRENGSEVAPPGRR